MRPERSAIYVALGMLVGSALLSLGVGSLLHSLLHFSVRDIRATIRAFGPLGAPAVTVMIAAIIVFIPIPTIPIEIVAGLAYGIVLGTTLVLAGHVLGAVIAFLLARKLGRPLLRRWLGTKTVERIDTLSVEAGFWWVFFMRLLPLFDFKLVSYASGLTSIRLRTYVVATASGIFMPILILDAIGATAGAQPREAAMIGAAYSLAVAGTIAYFLIPRRRKVVHVHHTEHGLEITEEVELLPRIHIAHEAHEAHEAYDPCAARDRQDEPNPPAPDKPHPPCSDCDPLPDAGSSAVADEPS